VQDAAWLGRAGGQQGGLRTPETHRRSTRLPEAPCSMH
jgi:hypothetical protein